VIDYADAGFTDAEIAEERRLCDEMSAAHEKGV
jgi:hypothetical protein